MKVQIDLTTTGRKSGLPHEVTLYGFEDGDRLIVVGSYGGAIRDPHWVLNLRAEPRAQLHRGKKVHEVKALEVDGAERERLWHMVVAAFPLYAAYQERTERAIPLFALQASENG